MSNLGVGAMIGLLSGNENSVKAFQGGVEKEIKTLHLDSDANDGDGALVFEFADDTKIALQDHGRSCCESRYMTTDDKLNDFVGSNLLSAEVREGPTVEGEWGDTHDIEFLVVTTTKGTFTVETHNKHNGYYGGFYVRCVVVEN